MAGSARGLYRLTCRKVLRQERVVNIRAWFRGLRVDSVASVPVPRVAFEDAVRQWLAEQDQQVTTSR